MLIFRYDDSIIKLPHNILIFNNAQGVYFYLLVKMQTLFSHTLLFVRKCCVVAIMSRVFRCVRPWLHTLFVMKGGRVR